MQKFLLCFLFSFLFGLFISPIIIKIAKKLKAKQTILHYVEAHKQKNGTPTLGGLIFIFSATSVFLCFQSGANSLSVVALLTFLAFGLLGFLDDFIKIKTHKNLGLRAYQKIIGQVGISIFVAIFVYKNIGTSLYLPFGMNEIDIGFFIIPLVVFVIIATTNSANLTDGLDGLLGGVSFVALIAVFIILLLTKNYEINLGANLEYLQEMNNLSLLTLSLAGGVLAFLCFNSYPAKIFMGDTGSLSLGGAICTITTFCGQMLTIVFICITFVVSSLSVIVQVLHYKRTKKRIFLMAPLHHHFEKKGVNETKIVAIYIIITIIASAVAILLCML